MRRLLVAIAGTVVLVSHAHAVGFLPKMSDVCVDENRKPSPFVDRKRFLRHLLKLKQVDVDEFDIDSGADGIPYSKKAAIVINPGNCSTCEPATRVKLGRANTLLVDFLDVHSQPLPPGASGYEVKSSSGRIPTVTEFLTGAPSVVRVACVDRSKPGGNESTAKKPNPDALPQYFAIRKNVDDLRFTQQEDKFKGLERASATFKDDYLNNTKSVSIEGVAGYMWGAGDFGNAVGRFGIFGTYKQDFFKDPRPKKSSRLENVGGGVIGDFLFPAFGTWHNLQFYPKYVEGVRTNEKIMSGNVVYSPEPDWSPFGHVWYLIPEVLSFQLTPQAKAIYGHVFDDGGDSGLLAKGDYFRFGPRLVAALYGEGPVLGGFVLTAAYEYYKATNGTLDYIERWETALNYAIGEQQLWALQLKYVTGRDLDTLQKQQQLTFGIGLKY